MTTSLEMLEFRVKTLESELSALKGSLLSRRLLPELWHRLSERSATIRHWIDSSQVPLVIIEMMRQELGLEQSEPIGAEQLQALLIAEGHDPTSRETSQMLIDARDEG